MNSKIKFKEGDKVTIELVGLGKGFGEIVSVYGSLYVYEKTQGHICLKKALESDSIIIKHSPIIK